MCASPSKGWYGVRRPLVSITSQSPNLPQHTASCSEVYVQGHHDETHALAEEAGTPPKRSGHTFRLGALHPRRDGPSIWERPLVSSSSQSAVPCSTTRWKNSAVGLSPSVGLSMGGEEAEVRPTVLRFALVVRSVSMETLSQRKVYLGREVRVRGDVVPEEGVPGGTIKMKK